MILVKTRSCSLCLLLLRWCSAILLSIFFFFHDSQGCRRPQLLVAPRLFSRTVSHWYRDEALFMSVDGLKCLSCNLSKTLSSKSAPNANDGCSQLWLNLLKLSLKTRHKLGIEQTMLVHNMSLGCIDAEGLVHDPPACMHGRLFLYWVSSKKLIFLLTSAAVTFMIPLDVLESRVCNSIWWLLNTNPAWSNSFMRVARSISANQTLIGQCELIRIKLHSEKHLPTKWILTHGRRARFKFLCFFPFRYPFIIDWASIRHSTENAMEFVHPPCVGTFLREVVASSLLQRIPLLSEMHGRVNQLSL